jgi:AcrR family transcriptional regulator
MVTPVLPPNKHQEKSLRTRRLLLDAAIDSLVDVGYGHASIADIAARAGVTRGAQLHHFRTRTELFAQTIEHLAARQREALDDRLRTLNRTASAAEVLVELVVTTFSGTLGKASVELYVAIANDDELRHRMLRVQHDLTIDLLQTAAQRIGPDIASKGRLESAFWMTINLIRGTTLDEMLGRDVQRRNQVLGDWTRLAGFALNEPHHTH